MRIRKVRIKNIASLAGEQSIDFTTEPLSSATLFAITGDTGAGKSSILDAICLALYAAAPRLRTAGDTEKMEKYLAKGDKAIDNIALNDPRSLLRRGESEGYAYVEFEVRGEIYEAGWHVLRARNKPDGKLQETKRSIVRISYSQENECIKTPEGDQGKKQSVDETIYSLIGLRFEEFSRSVLLAQGDFAGFLRAKPKEKTNILEKITGTEIYGLISKKIFERTKQALEHSERIKQRIADLNIPTLDEQEAKQKELTAINDQIAQANQTILSLQARQAYRIELQKQSRAVAEAEQEKKVAEIEAAAFDEQRLLLQRLDAAEAIRQCYFDRQKSSQAVEVKGADLKKEEATILTLENAIQEAIRKEEQAIAARSLLDTHYNPILKDLPRAESLDALCDTAEALHGEMRRRYNEQERMKDRLNKEICRKESELASCAKDILASQQTLESLMPYQILLDHLPLIESHTQSIASIQPLVADLTRQIAHVAQDISAGEIQITLLGNRLQQLNSQSPAEVWILRRRLAIGESCPVCGQMVNVLPNIHATTGNHLEEIDQERLNIQAQIDKLKEEGIRLQSDAIRLDTQHSAKLHDLQSLTQILCDSFSELIPNIKTRIAEGTLLHDAKRLLTKFEDARQSLEKLHQRAKEARDTISIIQADHLQALSLSLSLSNRLDILSSRTSALVSARAKILGGQSVKDARAIYDQEREAIDTAIQQSKEQRIKIQMDKEKCHERRTMIAQDIKQAKQEVAHADASISHWLNEQSLQESDLKSLFEDFLPTSPSIRQSIATADERKGRADATFEERTRTLAAHIKTMPAREDNEQTDDDLARSQHTIHQELNLYKEKATEIEAFFQRLKENKHEQLRLHKEAEAFRPILSRRERLSQDFGRADGEAFRSIAQAETLRLLTAYANHHLAAFAPRYRLTVVPGSLSLQVLDGYDSDRIRSVNSLSGGETFLCSLALALGLSSSMSGSARCDNLFIDEGFGSLDASSLDMAIAALERLEESGRTIGIISHVAELSERITTTIEVERMPGTGIGRIVVRG